MNCCLKYINPSGNGPMQVFRMSARSLALIELKMLESSSLVSFFFAPCSLIQPFRYYRFVDRHIDQELQPRIEVVPSHQMLHASKPQIHLESSPPNAVLGGDSPNFIVRGIPSHNLLHKTASVTHLEKLPEEKSENTLQPPPVMRKAVSKNFAETFHTDSGLPSRDLQGNAHHIYRGPPVSYQNYDKIPVNEPLHKNLKSESIREEVVVKKPQEPKYRNVRSSLIDPTTAKRMILLSNGDKNQRGITYVLNEKKVRTWDTLLREWTDRVKPTFGPVRRVFTPQSGTEIREFGGLQGNAVYVVSGYEKLRPLPHGYKVDTAVIDSHFNHNFLKKRTTKKAFPEKVIYLFAKRFTDAVVQFTGFASLFEWRLYP